MLAGAFFLDISLRGNLVDLGLFLKVLIGKYQSVLNFHPHIGRLRAF